MQPTQDPTPLGITNYLPISLGTGGTDETGVFATEKSQQRDKTDVVVFLHGQGQAAVSSYWKKEPFKLREEANRTGKSFILAVPYLGNPVNSGTLATDPDAVLAEILKNVGDPKPAVALGNLILAAHSGGGGPMLKMAMALKKCRPNLKACWGFDSMYQPSNFKKGEDIEPLWLQFMQDCAKSNPDVQFKFNYSGDPDTTNHSVVLLRNLKALPQGMPHLTIDIARTPDADLANVRKQSPLITTNHDAMVRDLWYDRLSLCTYLT